MLHKVFCLFAEYIDMPGLVHFPADVSIVTSTLMLPAPGEEHLQIPGVLVRDCPHSFSVVVKEGIPPLPQKTVDKIQK